MTLYGVLFTSIFVGWLLPPAYAGGPAPIKVTAVEFTSTPAPSNVMEMTTPYTRSQAVVTLADGSKATYSLTFQPLQRSGDYIAGWYYGLVVDKNGAPILKSPRTARAMSRAVRSSRPAPTACRCSLSPAPR